MKNYFVSRFLLIAIIAIGFGYFFYSSSLKVKEENSKLKLDLAAQERQWVELRRKQGDTAYTAQELEAVEKQVAEARGKVASMQSNIETREGAIRRTREEINRIHLRHRQKVWKEAKGMAFDEIRTAQGKVYTRVVISEVRPHEVSFMFGMGAGGHSLSLDQIPEEWVSKFMYTQEEVDAAKAAAKRRAPPERPAEKP